MNGKKIIAYICALSMAGSSLASGNSITDCYAVSSASDAQTAPDRAEKRDGLSRAEQPLEVKIGDLNDVHKGEQIKLPVYIKNTRDGFSVITFTVELPDGFVLEKCMRADLNGSITSDKTDNEKLTVQFLSGNGNNIKEDGVLCILYISVSENASAGEHEINTSEVTGLYYDEISQMQMYMGKDSVNTVSGKITVSEEVPAADRIVISAENVDAISGAGVKMPVKLSNTGSGFSVLQFNCELPEGFELITGASDLGQLSVGRTVNLVQFTESSGKNITRDGVLGELYIKVPSNTPDGRYPVSFTELVGISYNQTTGENKKLWSDSFTPVTGYIIIGNDSEETTPVSTTVSTLPQTTAATDITSVSSSAVNPAVTTPAASVSSVTTQISSDAAVTLPVTTADAPIIPPVTDDKPLVPSKPFSIKVGTPSNPHIGEESDISILLTNHTLGPISSVSFTLELPEGFVLNDYTCNLDPDAVMTCEESAEKGKYTLVFEGSRPYAILFLSITATEAAASGEHEITVSDVSGRFYDLDSSMDIFFTDDSVSITNGKLTLPEMVPEAERINITAGDVKAIAGTGVMMPVSVSNTGNGFSALNFSCELPEGFEIVRVASDYGKWSVNTANNTVEFTESNSSNITAEGVFGTFYIKVPEELPDGSYPVKFTKMTGKAVESTTGQSRKLWQDSFKTKTGYIIIGDVPAETTAVTTTAAPAVTTVAATTTQPAAVTTVAATTAKLTDVTTAASTTAKPAAVTTAASTTTQPAAVTTVAATTAKLIDVTTAASTTAKPVAVTTVASTTAKPVAVTTVASTTAKTATVTTAVSTTTQPAAVTTVASTTAKPEVVTAVATTTAKPAVVTTVASTTAKPVAVTTVASTTAKPADITTVASTTAKPAVVTTVASTTAKPAVVTTVASTTAKPEVVTAVATTTAKPADITTVASTTAKPAVVTTVASTTAKPEVVTTAASTTKPVAVTTVAATTAKPVAVTTVTSTTAKPADVTTVAATTSAAPAVTTAAVTDTVTRSGDADGNGVINSVDVICIIESIVNGTALADKENADMDKDGAVSLRDLMLLLNKFLNP